MIKALPILFASGLFCTSAMAEEVPFSDDRWDITGEEFRVEMVDGVEALFLQSGTAFLKDADFHNGIIEFDIMTNGGRGFSGAYFRFTDPGNGEDFYIRPHQSGNEDANQYTPVFNGLTGWQLYFGPSFSAPITYKVNEWMHIKIVINETRADVYIDSDEPVLHIAELKQANVAGWIGVDSGFAPVHFANFSFQKT
ncbi:MAG: family 16 glycoside hydrolase, partial [Sphingomonadales bacterium]